MVTFGVYRTSQAENVQCETCTGPVLKEEAEWLASLFVVTKNHVLCKDCYKQYVQSVMDGIKAYTRGQEIW